MLFSSPSSVALYHNLRSLVLAMRLNHSSTRTITTTISCIHRKAPSQRNGISSLASKVNSHPYHTIHRSTITNRQRAWATVHARAMHSRQEPESMVEHREAVTQIAASVRGFHERGEKFRIDHGSTNSTRKGALGRDPRKTVNTSKLNRVLHVDKTARTALVEPNVPMDRLVEATLPFGLIPPVVMEFPGITAGGGYSGTSGESSSFRHGFFDRTLRRVEMVLADGEVVTCSRDERPDLFHGAAGAMGTLGVTTLVEVNLVEASKYVETVYHPVSSMDDAIRLLLEFTLPHSDFDYVDGIMFSQKHGAIITGRLVDTPPADLPVQRFSAAHDPWFYLHVRSRIAEQASPKSPITDIIPLPEYLFRYDRGGFWVGEAPFRYFKGVPFASSTRWFLDDFLHTRMLYAALHGSRQSERLVVQDLALPYDTAKTFVDWTAERLGIWPLWLCPLKASPAPTMHPHVREAPDQPMLNIGLWGEITPRVRDRAAFLQANREIEAKLRELGGMKWLYAQTFASESEFWQDFDKDWYDSLRSKYRASGLPSVYEKVRAKQETSAEANTSIPLREKWPWAGFVGLWKAIQSKQYLLARNSTWKDWVPR